MFGKLFKNTNRNNSNLNRIDLTDDDQIEDILSLSEHKPVLLFKHSSRCGISSIVLKRFESKIEPLHEHYNYFILDIIKYRSLSNSLAKKFSVQHESPQLIVIHKMKVTDHDSHYGIMDVVLQ